MAESKQGNPPRRARKANSQRQLLVFLLIFPAVNLLFASAILYDLGLLNAASVGRIGARMWLTFGLALAVLRLLGTLLPAAVDPRHFWRQLIVHLIVIVTAGFLIGPTFNLPADFPRPGSMIMPRVFVGLEIVVYLAVMRMLTQQARAYEAEATLREAELNVLRSQSNPHFLFNTLNLISTEIAEDPDNAREIVYDLADLLRSNIKMAERSLTTLCDEMRLVRLYLKLQQKRFGDRLAFGIELAPETEDLLVPSLVLQPIVENTVKHAVAPYASAAQIHVQTGLTHGRLHITFKDSGPEFDDAGLAEGDGFRILRKTLALHYGDNYELALESTSAGGVLRLSLPARVNKRTRA